MNGATAWHSQVSSSCAVKLMQAYHPTGINHGPASLEKVRKPSDVTRVRDVCAAKKSDAPEVLTYRRPLGDVRPVFCRKMFGALFRIKTANSVVEHFGSTL